MPILHGRGFSFGIIHVENSTVPHDCTGFIKCFSNQEETSITGVQFQMSPEDCHRFQCYILNQLREDCSDRYAFTLYTMGFQLMILHPDAVEATVQVFVNTGEFDGDRVYAGAFGQVAVRELREFAESLSKMAETQSDD